MAPRRTILALATLVSLLARVDRPAWAGDRAAAGTPWPLLADGFESGDTTAWGDLADFSDGFDDSDYAGWTVLRPDLATVAVAGGELRVTPDDNTLWFQASQSVLVWKRITGNFRATAVVRSRAASDDSQPPPFLIHLGGLMARDGAAAAENYVFEVVGRDVNDLSIEGKTTDDAVSIYEGPSWAASDAELRLCRIGTTFHLYARPLSDPVWQQPLPTLATIDRPDLPATLQVGINAYAAQPAADLVVRVERVDFLRVFDVADCATD